MLLIFQMNFSSVRRKDLYPKSLSDLNYASNFNSVLSFATVASNIDQFEAKTSLFFCVFYISNSPFID